MELEKAVGAARYRAGLRSEVRALWTGATDYFQFWEGMMTTIQSLLTLAWYKGAAECGIQPAELSPEERVVLQDAIRNEMGYIDELAARVEENSKANGGKLTPLLTSLNVWANRYNDVENRAKLMACGDRKLKWVLGVAEHCSSCVKLHGKVKRASYWQARGVQPQNPPNALLECGGWNCQCGLIPTDGPASKGPLPRLP